MDEFEVIDDYPLDKLHEDMAKIEENVSKNAVDASFEEKLYSLDIENEWKALQKWAREVKMD